MPIPILTTKLYILPPRPNVILRPRLIARLNEGLHRKLTLIAAPAGFGKTTLVSSWVAEYARPTAWLSLDEGDNDPTRFLTYLVAALQTIAPTLGTGVLGILQGPQPHPTEVILTALLNEITTHTDDFILILDDYHLINATLVDDTLTFLLAHLPPQMHLVITTREDPPLPLARLRARGHLTELRAADLRFTLAEAAGFLNQVMGLSLSASDIATLEDRTEGWIAGLQLAALSMQGHQDVPSFIRTFAGDHRYIVDYLVDEVLQRQPKEVRSFLLQTAILDRLSGSLCDAVVDEGPRAKDESSLSLVARPSSFVLEELERGNFFVVPLDDTRQWYRYHHLFADVLAAQLRAEQPELVAPLHRRASAWYEEQGFAVDAIRHALAAADFARAADLVERAVPAMRSNRQEAAVLRWLNALPNDLIISRPVLSVYYAWALLSSGELAGVEGRLRDAERWLEITTDAREPAQARSAEMVVVDEVAFRRLPGSIAVFRAGQALALGDLAGTVTDAERALELIPEDDHLMRGAAASLLGIASWASGALEAAHRGYAQGMTWLQRAGNIADALGCAIALADIRIAQGRLHDAMRTYERALQLAVAQHPEANRPTLRGTAGLYVGLSELAREQNDLPAATQHLLSSKELGEHAGLPQHRYRWRIAMARIREAEGDLDSALALLDEAERVYVPDFLPNVRPVAALKTRVWLAQGRLGEALGWARAQGLSAQDDLSYLREFEHITLARLLLARSTIERSAHSMGEVIELLERLLQAAKAGERMGSVIEILVLQALTLQIQGDIPDARVPLSRALTLAEPEGYVRIFMDEGEAMRLIILDFRVWITQQPGVAQNTKMAIYTDTLLANFGDEPSNVAKPLLGEQLKIQSPKYKVQNLVEPLREREHDVLRLLRTDLSGPEIARELMVSLSTMRTHTRNIYTKLGVTTRRAAVHRAEELDLF